MGEFIKQPVNKHSLSKIGSVYGVGTNDADCMVAIRVSGKRVLCPIYTVWANMLKRCYCPSFLLKEPTYNGCTVCDEWLTFSSYSNWHKENYTLGFHLDKDLKVIGNKLYSPETCLFIPNDVNQLIITAHSNKGGHPTGVSFIKAEGKYRARITIDSKEKYLGRFNNPDAASKAYTKAKNTEIVRKCGQYPEFAEYLINHINFFNQ